MIIEKTENGIYKMLDLSELPKKRWAGKEVIDWESSIGKNIFYKYGEGSGKFKICNQEREENKMHRRIKLKHNNNLFEIRANNLLALKIREIVDPDHTIPIRLTANKYSLNQIIKTDTNSFTVKEIDYKQLRNNRKNNKAYLIQCNKCFAERWLEGYKITKETNCVLCSKRPSQRKNSYKFVKEKGLLETYPHFKGFLMDEEKDRVYKRVSEHIRTQCPDCGKRTNKTISYLNHYGFTCSCQSASSGERLVEQLLINNNIEYEDQYRIDHKLYFYDFYIPKENLIIEVHGGQHYFEVPHFKMSLKEVKINDRNKREYAIEKGYNYLELNASKGAKKLLKECRKLKFLTEFTFSLKNTSRHTRMREVIEKYKEGYRAKEIEELLNISCTDRIRLMETAEELSLIEWDRNRDHKLYTQTRKVKVVNINESMIFPSQTEAAKFSGLADSSSFSKNFMENQPIRRGKHPVTGEKLKWMYYEDYVEKYGTEGLTEYVEEESHN